jgi:hypothetical protein
MIGALLALNTAKILDAEKRFGGAQPPAYKWGARLPESHSLARRRQRKMYKILVLCGFVASALAGSVPEGKTSF